MITPEIEQAYNPITEPLKFIDGMKAAKEGKPHCDSDNQEFTRGYHAQKQLEAMREYGYGR